MVTFNDLIAFIEIKYDGKVKVIIDGNRMDIISQDTELLAQATIDFFQFMKKYKSDRDTSDTKTETALIP